ncbi:MAG: TRAP transporter small permease subunit [Rhodospirillales bacterium]|nr:TRAP transporter small permease subunit [Rhodospirillales bacterium]MDH3790612.1 TRAP transporter small permease subunit [Rhodospirillales bacterium]MDH3912337.1 TRAP transporter small permease subunit [Rhodospirillales bacterium]MDH3919705.1 TRAP transporter small permease subunit [Rhodospirillales bacterium]MDH3967731.1 TRAP transporter small permease subunit [Rhodospirillales bacterium]
MAGLAAFVRFVDRLNDVIGRGVAWLTLAMVLITFVVVILRYIYAIGWVWMQESYVWLHGIVFMLGAGYTLLHNGHVRVDIIYRTASPRYKSVIDLFGSLVLLLPLVVVVFLVSYQYVLASWLKFEESREAGGLPALFLLKTVILAFCMLLGLQGLALAGRSFLTLAGWDGFMPVEEEHEAL